MSVPNQGHFQNNPRVPLAVLAKCYVLVHPHPMAKS